MKNIIAKTLVTFAAVAAFAASANAQETHLLTPRIVNNNWVGIYEVVAGYGNGGRYTNRAHYVGNFKVDGYTDRVSRGDILGTVILGSGNLTELGVTANGRQLSRAYNVPLPFLNVQYVSMSPSYSYVDIYTVQRGRKTTTHVPIGTR